MSGHWNDLQRYVIEEHFEDYVDGRISRREMLRRVSLVTGSVAASLVALSALGCNVDQPRAAASASASASPAPVPPSARAADLPFATPPPTGSVTNAVTVKPDDPRLRSAGDVSIPSSDRKATLIGYQAFPANAAKPAGILVMHENRGLTDHIKDVIRRVATAGFMGFGIDLLSRQGGVERFAPDAYAGALANTTVEQMNADLLTAIQFIQSNAASGSTQPTVGAVGFCFGGGTTWNILIAGAPLKAAVPFYGPLPTKVDGLAATKAAVLAIYAEQDTRITQSWPQAEEQLKKAGVPYASKVENGVGHAFHNDTGGSRYGPAQAQDAWVAAIEWFRKYL